MHIFFAVISFVIIIAVTIPYMRDVIKGRARPARAARVMLFLLLIITLLQQHDLGSGYAMTVTFSELLSSALLLGLALKYGVGGLALTDKICYCLLAIDLMLWLLTKNTLLALHLTILADTISFWPTLEKTWRLPQSETKLFFWGGVIAPLFSIAAQNSFTYSVIVFPAYLSVINLVEIAVINSGKIRASHSTNSI